MTILSVPTGFDLFNNSLPTAVEVDEFISQLQIGQDKTAVDYLGIFWALADDDHDSSEGLSNPSMTSKKAVKTDEHTLTNPIATKTIDAYTESDVFCGRGKANWHHTGNRLFRDLVQAHVDSYMEAGNKKEKTAIVYAIVDQVREQGGRFLQRSSNGRLYELERGHARDKVGHSLRDQVNSTQRRQMDATDLVPLSGTGNQKRPAPKRKSKKSSSPGRRKRGSTATARARAASYSDRTPQQNRKMAATEAQLERLPSSSIATAIPLPDITSRSPTRRSVRLQRSSSSPSYLYSMVSSRGSMIEDPLLALASQVTEVGDQDMEMRRQSAWEFWESLEDMPAHSSDINGSKRRSHAV